MAIVRNEWQPMSDTVRASAREFYNRSQESFHAGMIYVATDGLFTKIGKTKQMPMSRVRWSGGALPSFLVAFCFTETASSLEIQIKRALRDHRFRSCERFMITPDETIKTIRKLGVKKIVLVPNYKKYMAPMPVRQAVYDWQHSFLTG